MKTYPTMNPTAVREYLLEKPNVVVPSTRYGTWKGDKQYDAWLDLRGVASIGIARRTGNVEFYPFRAFEAHRSASGLDRDVMTLLQRRTNAVAGVSYKDDVVIACPDRQAIDWAYDFMTSYGSLVYSPDFRGVADQLGAIVNALRK